MDNGVGITAVIREHVADDHCIRSELVGGGNVSTQSCGFIDIGAV